MRRTFFLLAAVVMCVQMSLSAQGLGDIAGMLDRVNTLKGFVADEPEPTGKIGLDKFVTGVFDSSHQSVSISEQLIKLAKGEKLNMFELMALAKRVKEQAGTVGQITKLIGPAASAIKSERSPLEKTKLASLFKKTSDASSVLVEETKAQSNLIEALIAKAKG